LLARMCGIDGAASAAFAPAAFPETLRKPERMPVLSFAAAPPVLLCCWDGLLDRGGGASSSSSSASAASHSAAIDILQINDNRCLHWIRSTLGSNAIPGRQHFFQLSHVQPLSARKTEKHRLVAR
jgi:hypothetical protein